MYLVVIGVLGLVLTVSSPPCSLVVTPGLVSVAVAVATLLPAVVGFVVARRAVCVLDREPDHPSHGQAVFGRGMSLIQLLLAAGHGAVFLCTGWMPLCEQMPVVGKWPIIPVLLALVPFLLSILLVWITVYPADRAVRQIAVELYLLRGKPLRPVWPLLQYVLYNLRHQVLFILVPMLLILAVNDVVMRNRDAIRRFTKVEFSADLLVGCAAIAVAVVAPEILRHVWITQRLPDGPLRDRLQSLADRLRLRCRDILVWRSGGMIVNAAVMGVVAPLRYVLITDGMLEQLEDTKIEAVFGHEAGHVKRHHILFFLLFGLVSGCIVTIFSVRVQGLPRETYNEWLTMLLGVLALKWVVFFGWISRRFERQADIFGVRSLALSGLPCAAPCVLHTATDNPGHPPAEDALCSTAAHVFGDALNDVALLNGIRPDARSWRHSSISSRSRFLQDLAQNPARAQRFERTVLMAKAAIFLAALVGAIWAAHDLRIWAALGQWLR